MIPEQWLAQLRDVIDSLGYIPEKEWLIFKEKLYVKEVDKDGFFIFQNEKPTSIGFVVDGIFRSFFQLDNYEERTLSFNLENSFLHSYSSMTLDTNANYSIQAIKKSTLLVISIKDFKDIAARCPNLKAVAIFYISLMYAKKEEKERWLLQNDARVRFKMYKDAYPDQVERIPQYLIANYLGITPVTLSRVANKEKVLV